MKISEDIIGLSIVAGVAGIWFIAVIIGSNYFLNMGNYGFFSMWIFVLLPVAFFIGFFIIFIRLLFTKINAMNSALRTEKITKNVTE